MLEFTKINGMTISVLENCPPCDFRVVSVQPDKRMSEEIYDDHDDPAQDAGDLEEGEISDDIEAEESVSASEGYSSADIKPFDAEPVAAVAEAKLESQPDKHTNKKEKDSKHDRRTRRHDRKDDRRDKRRREEDDKDRSRKKRRDDKSTKKSEHDTEHNAEEDDELLFIRGASPSSRPQKVEATDSKEVLNQSEEQKSPSNRDQRRDDRQRRRSRSRSRTRHDDRAKDRDRDRRDRDRDRIGDGRNRRERDERPKPRQKFNELCISYFEGRCKRGDDCRYIHSDAPHRKLELCKFYLLDTCTKKDKCSYMHKEFPCKYHHTGAKHCRLTEKQCKFSHAPLTEVTRAALRKHVDTAPAPKDVYGETNRVPHSDQHSAEYPPARGHIPSIFDLNVKPPPGLAYKAKKDQTEAVVEDHNEDDDEDESGLQIDLDDASKVEEETVESIENINDTESEQQVVISKIDTQLSGDDAPSDAVPVKKSDEVPTQSVSSLPIKMDKLSIAEALHNLTESLSAEQLTQMLEFVKNKSSQVHGDQPKLPTATPAQQPQSLQMQTAMPLDDFSVKLSPVSVESTLGASLASSASAAPTVRDPRLARDPRQRAADPRLKQGNVVSSVPKPQPQHGPKPDMLSLAGKSIPAKTDVPKSTDVDLMNKFVLPPLTLSDKDYRPNDIDMRQLISQGPINPFTSGIDLRQKLPDPLSMLPFRPAPMHPPAREIDASLNSHPPLEWKVINFNPPAPDYSYVKFNPADASAILDPRLQRFLKKGGESGVTPVASPLSAHASPNLYNPAIEKPQVAAYDPRADLKMAEGFVPRRVDPRLARR